MTEASKSVVPGGNGFPEAADHEERVVDSQAQPQHGGQILNQNGQVPTQARNPAIAIVVAMASWPTANGIRAATTLPKATSRSASVTGITRLSACCTSSALAFRMSKLSGVSPVSSIFTAG